MQGRTVTVVCRDIELQGQLVRTLATRGVAAMPSTDLSLTPGLDSGAAEPLRVFVVTETIASALSLLPPMGAGRQLRVAVITPCAGANERSAATAAGALAVLPVPWTDAELDAALGSLFADRGGGIQSDKTPEKAGSSVDFYVESTLESIRDSVEYILALLVPYTDERTLRFFRVTLQEALRNAVEHGNLGITSAEKAQLCEAGTFDTEVERRLLIAQGEGKRVHVIASVDDDEFRCRVSDEGSGFDWRIGGELAAATLPDGVALPHGRGIALIRHFYDTVIYNELGNVVTLVKRLNPVSGDSSAE